MAKRKVRTPSVTNGDVTEKLVGAYREAINGFKPSNSEKVAFRIVSRESLDVKKIREMAGLTQGRLAQLLDMNISAIQHWEQGKRKPSSTSKIVLEAIAIVAEERAREIDQDSERPAEECSGDSKKLLA